MRGLASRAQNIPAFRQASDASGCVILSSDGADIPEMSKTLCVAATALMLSTIRISAHHSFAAEYDENKRVTVSGTVTSFDWANPHAWLYVDAKDANGKVTNWGFEMGSPGGLIHRGWTRTALKKGDHVTVDGYGAKDGSNRANARTV